MFTVDSGKQQSTAYAKVWPNSSNKAKTKDLNFAQFSLEE